MSRATTPDLTGRRFGRLVVQSQTVTTIRGRRQSICHCLCDCGEKVDVAAYHLQKADGSEPKSPTRSCGCVKTLGDLTGKRFYRLIVIEEAASDEKEGRCWRCLCDCGNVIIVSASALCSGLVKSCGCFRKESAAKRAKIATRAAHTQDAEKKRTKTVYGDIGSKARKNCGIKLQNELKKSGAIVDHANVAQIVADDPKKNNPYRGVCWNKHKKSWIAYCQVKKTRWQKAGFKTPEDAKAARDEKQKELLELYGLNDAVQRREIILKSR